MGADNYNLIKDHFKSIWDDFLVIQFMDLNFNERAAILRMYREEINPSQADNSWCGACVTEMFKNLINLYESICTSNGGNR